MPVKTQVFAQSGLVVTRAMGMIDDLSVLEHQSLIESLPGFESTFNYLIDARMITENLLSRDGVIQMSGATPFGPSIKRVYVVGDEKSCMLATLAGSVASMENRFYVTYEIKDACEWLGISYNEIINSSIYEDNE